MNVLADVIAYVKDDATLGAALGAKVYGHRIPDKATPDLVLVTSVSTNRATFPQTAWWREVVSLDFHSLTPATSLALAERFQEIAPQIVGSHSNSVVTDCQVESRQPVTDDGWTPTRFRQVVTVELTAREP